MKIKIYTNLGNEYILDCDLVKLQNRAGTGMSIKNYGVKLKKNEYVIGTTIIDE